MFSIPKFCAFCLLYFGGRGCIMYLQGKERALKNLQKKNKKVLTNNNTYGIIIIERERQKGGRHYER